MLASSRVCDNRGLIKAPIDAILSILHNPVDLIKLSTHTVSISRTFIRPQSYNVTIKLVFFGGIAVTTTATAHYSKTICGATVAIDAGKLFRSEIQWKAHVSSDDKQATEVEQAVNLTAFAPLMPFFSGSFNNQALDGIADRVESRVTVNEVPIQSPSTSNEWYLCWAASFLLLALPFPEWVKPLLAASLGLLPLVSILHAGYRRVQDPYGLWHLELNSRPGEKPGDTPTTEWLNMGYWKDTNVFPDACQALALKLIDAGKCVPHGNVLDVGHACGDSLLLHISHPRVSRPSKLTGITSLSIHRDRASARIRKLEGSTMHPIVDLHVGDAIYHPSTSPSTHPLNPHTTVPPFTTILALDCAQHFQPRSTFLEQAFVRLAPGGTLALADTCISREPPLPLSFILSIMLGVPRQNLVTPQQYRRTLLNTGFQDVVIQDITDEVYPSFIAFLRGKQGAWSVFATVMGWWARAGGRFIIVSASRPAI